MKIRVDNIASDTTEDDLRMLFELFGAVAAVTIDQRRRWGQIDMPSKSAAREAIAGLNGQNLKGFDMAVEEMAARPTGRPRGKPRRGRRSAPIQTTEPAPGPWLSTISASASGRLAPLSL